MFRICLIWIFDNRDSTRIFCRFWTLSFLHALSSKHRNLLRWTIFFVCSAAKIHRLMYSYAVFMSCIHELYSWDLKNRCDRDLRTKYSTVWKITVIVIFASAINSTRFIPACIKNLKIIFVNDSEKAWFDDFTVCCFQNRKSDFVQFTTPDLMT